MIPRIEDVPQVEIGHLYDVPCVAGSGNCYLLILSASPHADPDLGVAREHRHYDPRFLTEAEIRLLNLWLAGHEAPAEPERVVMLVVDPVREATTVVRSG